MVNASAVIALGAPDRYRKRVLMTYRRAYAFEFIIAAGLYALTARFWHVGEIQILLGNVCCLCVIFEGLPYLEGDRPWVYQLSQGGLAVNGGRFSAAATAHCRIDFTAHPLRAVELTVVDGEPALTLTVTDVPRLGFARQGSERRIIIPYDPGDQETIAATVLPMLQGLIIHENGHRNAA